MAKKFIISGIKPPGRINAMVAGKFRDVDLFTAPDTVLEELYNNKVPYITMSEQEYIKRNKNSKKIEVKAIKSKSDNS